MKETISVNSISKITENLDIVKVVSDYLNLKKAGKNFKALCPFHEEKTPSFVVNPEKQIFHCFGCGVGGDAIKFLMSIENINFPQAVALAAEKAGVRVALGRYSPRDSEEAERIYRANEFASAAYQSILFSDDGKTALEYLLERNLKEADIKSFSIGLAPGRMDELAKRAREAKLDMGDFVKAGLVKDGGKTDVFRNRIIFPIFDSKGKIAGFGGRALDEKQMPKYLNTGENPVFNKGKILYGMNWASGSIKEKGFALLVEGYFDVIKLHMNGVKNAIAPMGTSLTGAQLGFLKRFTDNVLLLFDSDQAGIKASLRNLEVVLNKGFETKLCLLPAGFDPDKFIDDYGINPFIGVINKSRNFLEFSLDIYSQQYGTDTPKGKSSVAREVMKYIELLPDEIEKSEYRKILAGKLDIKEETLSQYSDSGRKEERQDVQNDVDSKVRSRDSAESLLVEIMLSDQQCWKQLLDWKGEVTPRINLIAKVSKELLSKNVQLTPSNLITGITGLDAPGNMNGWVSELALRDTSSIEEERKQLIFQDCLKKIHKLCICEQLDCVKKEMNAKKGNGLQYGDELEAVQRLLFELKKE
ncbi:MAG TPA: DNA primase [bacterium]|nr:DNA primase [bacterium]